MVSQAVQTGVREQSLQDHKVSELADWVYAQKMEKYIL
jgi:hypothetical protein